MKIYPKIIIAILVFLKIAVSRFRRILNFGFIFQIMSDYNKEEIKRIEAKWRQEWDKRKVYRTDLPGDVAGKAKKPKYYVLDMFPYPSGVGLHVGHPLGYIASDIVARFKRLKGFNVLHPMGFDAFGLPAEQYAIQTGQHPAITTAKNIETYKRQLKQIGFSYDWSREVITSDPDYYKWTQWIFMQLFDSWYNKKSTDGLSSGNGNAENISTLISQLEINGNLNVDSACDDDTPKITAAQWKGFNKIEREEFLQRYRIAYQREAIVNWCQALGSVLSNDEVKDGVSERGGYPVERIKMMQWSMRITAYAERLLSGLNSIDWPEAVKEMQRNWIGKSIGCDLEFQVVDHPEKIRVFTTRIDTIYGVTFMVLAPEHELVGKITTADQYKKVTEYVEVAKNRSERDRMSDVKHISGEFTGAYVINPFNQKKIPLWIADYVLAGYGTGAVMAVPSSDTRDYAFAKHFDLPVVEVLSGPTSDITRDNFEPKSGTMINSDFLNGLAWNEAIEKALEKVNDLGIGELKVNYRMRDAIFGRQRYWGEPFPIYYKDGTPQLVLEDDLPITLPEVDEYKPTENGDPPLARAKNWLYRLTPNPSPKERGFETSEKAYWHTLKKFSKENRQDLTEAESILWQELRNNKLGYKIRRQHAIGIFIADFVCLPKRLAIEIDGAYHMNNKEYDAARTAFLNQYGFTVIRFTNEKVKMSLPDVLAEIKSTLGSLPSNQNTSPSPPEKGPGDEAYPFELTTMPGWAGSSWYWFRYMASQKDRLEDVFVPKRALDYWKDVDLYIGGSEHATGHLLYSRFWCKALRDLGYVEPDEPFRKLINQGHIQGVSKFVYRVSLTFSRGEASKKTANPEVFISKTYVDEDKRNKLSENKRNVIKQKFEQGLLRCNQILNTDFTAPFFGLDVIQPIHVDINLVVNDKLDIQKFRDWRPEYKNAIIITDENDEYICGSEIEKMSKSKFNVVNPDDIIDSYGADTLRMYEMFLGPLEQSKPWNTNGIDGVFKFLRRFWNLFHNDKGNPEVVDAVPTRAELKVLHKTIKKIEQDVETYSFNTSVSELMICVNELTALKTNKRAILEPLVICIAPFAPHMAEELWEQLEHTDTVLNASYPAYQEDYLKENSFEYPISINGKVRAKMEFALDMPKEDIEKVVLASEIVNKWTEGKPPKKIIVVQGRIVNVVL
jgi:leucyl-tRNA synthetase